MSKPHTWSGSTPVVTHCTHGVDLRLTPRCYLCEPEARATPDTRLREAIDYAAEAAHHRYWDSNFQDGHTGQDWRECNAWPCLDIFAAKVEETP